MKILVKDIVSIVVPVYNTKVEYLQECFDSILNQSYEKIELIIVNDGSRVGETNEFCRSYAKEHEGRCILIEKENEGVSVARFAGLMEAQGACLMFVDSDDTLEPDCVLRLTEVKAKYEADAVIGEDYVRTGMEPVRIYNGNLILEALLENEDSAFGWALWAKLFDTELMRYYYKPRRDIYYGEDLLVNADYFSNANKVVIINEKVYNYRTDNPDSAMKQAVSVKKLSLIKMWNEMAQIYSVHGKEEAVRKIKANYYDSLLSGYLQCEYHKYDNYKKIMRDIKTELEDNMSNIMSNPYVKGKLRYILAVKCLWLYRLKRYIKEKKNAEKV